MGRGKGQGDRRWSVGKINGKRVYWRGDSKPPNIDEDLRGEVRSS